MKTMCFTGRRPKDLYGYDHDKYIPIVNAHKNYIKFYASQGYTEFISGGAQGFDQLAFWAVNAVKREGCNIRNVVYMPFEGQEKAWKETGLFSQQEYKLMLRLADEVCILNKINVNNRQEVVNALYHRNHVMVDNSNLVFGLYPDDTWKNPKTKGGTAECLRYAQSKGKAIYQFSHVSFTGKYQ